MSLKLALSTEGVPVQPGILHREILSLKTKIKTFLFHLQPLVSCFFFFSTPNEKLLGRLVKEKVGCFPFDVVVVVV